MQKAVLNRNASAPQTAAGLAPKLERPQIYTRPSVTTPSSHASSPSRASVRSPGVIPSGGVHSPTSIHLTQQQGQHPQQFSPHQQHKPHFQPLQPAMPASARYTSPAVSSASGPTTSSVGSGSVLYPSPFRSHYDQLGKLVHPLFHLMELCRPRFDP